MIIFHLWQVDFENILIQSHTIHENMKQSTQNWPNYDFSHFAAKKTLFYVGNCAIFTHKNVIPELDKAKNGRIEVT